MVRRRSCSVQSKHCRPGRNDVTVKAARPWLQLLAESDLAHIAKLRATNLPDPGVMTWKQHEAMSELDRTRYKRTRIQYLSQIPIRRLPSRSALYEELEDERDSDVSAGWSRSGAHPVSVINGPAGVGKSAILDSELSETMQLAAKYRWLDAGAPDHIEQIKSEKGYEPRFIPTVKYEATEGTTVLGLIEGLLKALGRPIGRRNPHSHLHDALRESGTQLVAFDEVQRINFDGKTGQHVHGFFRELSEHHCRLILATNHAKWVLDNPKRTRATSGSMTSTSRWVVRDVAPLRFNTEPEQLEWMSVLRGLEDRIRLVDQPGPGWLHVELAAYLHAVTEGHLNSLVRLLNTAFSRALRLGDERIDQKLLDGISVEPEHEAGRAARVAALTGQLL